jgi:serine/threonine-protein kinase HipA
MTTPPPLPERIRALDVAIAGRWAGQLLRHSVFEFRYLRADEPAQPAVSLSMPPAQPTWQDGDVFPVMDQNLPEGDLFARLRALFPKQPLTPMHLLALIGAYGIGRLGFHLPGRPLPPPGRTLGRATLLSTRYTPQVFDELVSAYLATGAGIAGMQPKIMVPDRATVPIPTLIVKAASPAYPSLAANEYLCLSAAQRAGIEVPGFDLSDDGQMLLLDRFDIGPEGQRSGFEDVAALMGLRVRDTLSDRKYQGSYERVATLLRAYRLPADSLARFFEQLALSVMVRNGDAHLKNFGVLYTCDTDARLAPLFDVVTTSIYRYRRYEGGPELEDRTLALKLLSGKGGSKAYPGTDELLDFGRRICGVAQPAQVLQRLAQGMRETLQATRGDDRIPAPLHAEMSAAWEQGLAYRDRRRPSRARPGSDHERVQPGV